MSLTIDECEERLILKCVMGSTAFGLNTPESDVDLMGVVIPPIEQEIGLGQSFETLVPAKVEKGDLTYYSLRHFCKLAANGNPTVLAMFFAPIVKADARGNKLREQAPFYASRRAGNAFAGFLHQQREHAAGNRGNGGHGKPRQDLIDAFGYDTKFAMHMLRLGFQGIEYLKTGVMSLPMQEHERAYLMGVREGKYTLEACLRHAEDMEADISEFARSGPLPEEPNWTEINRWMLKMHLRNWSADQAIIDRFEDPPFDTLVPAPDRVKGGKGGKIL